MKLHYSHTNNTVKKKVTFESKDAESFPKWLVDTRSLELDSEYIEVEAPSLPIVTVGRAFSQHLGQIGILDLYDGVIDSDSDNNTSSEFVCKFQINLEFANQQFQLVLDLNYTFRREEYARASHGLTASNVADWLFDLVVHGRNSAPLTEIRMRHYLFLTFAYCSINGLEIVL